MESRIFTLRTFLMIFRGIAPLVLASGCASGTTAYTILVTEPGNQASSNITLGLDFDVNLPIDVTALGVFDSLGDGLIGTLSVAIFDRNTQLIVGPTLSFTGSGDTLVGATRFRSITPLMLLPGNYTVGSWGYGSGADPNGCSFCGNQFTLSTEDTGGGLITFVGSGRTSPYSPPPGGAYPIYPTNIGPSNVWHAGNFQFTGISAIPEPGTLGMFGLGGATLLGLIKLRARRSRQSAGGH
jgi:hypothetical protein